MATKRMIVKGQGIAQMPKVEGRTCGDCRLCCRVMRVTSEPENFVKEQGTWCQHAHFGGCRIYDKRPIPCVSFQCAWLNGAFGERARPDRIHMVVALEQSVGDKVTDANGKVILKDMPVWCVYESWPGVSKQPKGRALLAELEQMIVVKADDPNEWAGPFPVCIIPSATGTRTMKLPGQKRYVPCLREGEDAPTRPVERSTR